MNRLTVVIIFVVVIICGLVVTDLFAQEAVTTADLDISAKEQVRTSPIGSWQRMVEDEIIRVYSERIDRMLIAQADPAPVTTAEMDISAKEQVVYPAEIADSTDKLVYALKVQEAARRLHNEVGLWTKGPISEKAYNAWPEDVRAVLPAWKEGVTLSQEDFEKFREVYEENYSQPAVNDILAIKEEIRKLSNAELNVSLEGVKK